MRQEPVASILDGAAALFPMFEVERYREMREDYLERCAKLPTMNRCAIAMLVCAYGFEIEIARLVAHDRSSIELVESRQKLMAFCRIVSLDTPRINTWKGIARTFRRTHSTVIHATQKYGAQIALALEVAQ